MNTTTTVNKALAQLETITGIKGFWKPQDANGQDMGIDGTLDLYFQDKPYHLFAEVRKELRNYQLPGILQTAKRHKPMMLVADHIFPTLKEQLRKEEVNYLDAAGNIYLKTNNNLIWLDGQARIKEEKQTTNRAFTKTGLKVVFLFLLNEQALNLPYRALATMADVALGNINNIIEGLNEAGFIINIDQKTMALQNKKALLERWITGYGEILKPTLQIGKLRFPKELAQAGWQNAKAMGNTATLWGGEPAAEAYTGYLHPQIFTMYTVEPMVQLMKKWKLVPDENGNVHLYHRFWQGNPFFIDKDQTHDLPLVPPLLVYADLVLTNDPRCLETAEIIYNQYLKHAIE